MCCELSPYQAQDISSYRLLDEKFRCRAILSLTCLGRDISVPITQNPASLAPKARPLSAFQHSPPARRESDIHTLTS